MHQSDAEVERLVALCRLWGAIRWFHPSLAEDPGAWDRALAQAIPRVRDASSTARFRAEIERLLSVLDDPATTVQSSNPAEKTSQAQPSDGSGLPATTRWVDDADAGKLAVLVLRDVDYSHTESETTIAALLATVGEASAVIVDTRDMGEHAWRFNPSLLFCGKLTLPSYRYRFHSGWMPEAGGAPSFESGFIVVDSQIVSGQGSAVVGKRLAFVLDETTPGQLAAVAEGLEARGDAVVMWSGPRRPPRLATVPLSDELCVELRTGERLGPDGTVATAHPHGPRTGIPGEPKDLAILTAMTALAGRTATMHAPAEYPRPGKREVSYYLGDAPSTAGGYPPVEARLIALFKHWNVIRYHYAYRHLLDRPWEHELREFIPRIVSARDEIEYALALAEYNGHLRDTHGAFISTVFDRWLGEFQPQLGIRLLDGETVVDFVGELECGIAPGDVVLEIDGEPVAQRRKRLAPYFAASTEQALEFVLHRGALLRGGRDSVARISLRTVDGDTRIVEIARTARRVPRPPRPYPVFGRRADGIGYIDLVRLGIRDVESALDSVREAPGLVIDIRGYPRGAGVELASRLARRSVVGALFSRPEPKGPDEGDDHSQYAFAQRIEPSGTWTYVGKIAVLIDENAISQSEHCCLLIESATEGRARFVGTPTNGANGDATSIRLPGGITTMFSGHDVRHSDGSQLQRRGIVPHLTVAPTPRGIAAGSDEVLDAAIELLRGGKEDDYAGPETGAGERR